jgi:NAD+ kinase
VIGVVGADAPDVTALLRDAGFAARPLDATDLGTVEAVVTVGETALVAVAADAPDCPVLAMDVDRRVPSVSRDDLAATVESLLAGDAATRDRALLSVAAGDRRLRALFEVMLVTAGPAQISEYRVETTADGDRRTLDSVRADGVVVATPAGSWGYARDAGGPTVVAGTDALAVVPVAPFTVDPHRWVVSPPLSVTVAREESAVELRVDGRERGTVARGDPVRVARDGTLTLVEPSGPA